MLKRRDKDKMKNCLMELTINLNNTGMNTGKKPVKRKYQKPI
jgi:hypothetical protein